MSEPVPETTVIAPDGDEPKTRFIAPDGDVILVVGAAPKTRLPQTGLRGRVSHPPSPKEIELPEDSPKAMDTISCVLHHQNDQVLESMGSDDLFNIAVHADKYDLIRALKLLITLWLTTSNPLYTSGMVDDGYRLTTAFIIRDSKNFARISVNLITQHAEPYSEIYKVDQLRDRLPRMILYSLEERRTKMRYEIHELWAKGIKETCHETYSSTTCKWGYQRMERYKLLCKRFDGGRIIADVPISTLIRESKKASTEDMTEKSHCKYSPSCRCSDTYTQSGHSMVHHSTIQSEETFAGQLKCLKKRFGLCFDCLDCLEGKKEKCAHQEKQD
ncbi:hypothetical protein QBC37DRAFT_456712 [Rhypophila decipiens]|uniref:Uncharacterized protein n=1 Tax=Rhypophila decipiens TaxID=261697 RepID=A0AAN7B3P0_9PEZI|nr:hypothetical protein QBC37DRAFT_456712 [Rhypophila decipiens]